MCMSVLGARPSAPAALPDPLPKALLLWASLTPYSLGGGSAVGKGHSLHGVLSGSQQHEDTQDASVGQWPSAPLAGKPGEQGARAWARGLVDAQCARRAPGFDGGVVTGRQQELLLLGAEDH